MFYGNYANTSHKWERKLCVFKEKFSWIHIHTLHDEEDVSSVRQVDYISKDMTSRMHHFKWIKNSRKIKEHKFLQNCMKNRAQFS